MALLRILVADDKPLVRAGIRMLLEPYRNWTVCGEAANGREAIAQAIALKPNVILLDVSMPELDGLTALPLIRQRVPDAAIVIMTLHESLDVARIAADLGVTAYIAKSRCASELIPTMEYLDDASGSSIRMN